MNTNEWANALMLFLNFAALIVNTVLKVREDNIRKLATDIAGVKDTVQEISTNIRVLTALTK